MVVLVRWSWGYVLVQPFEYDNIFGLHGNNFANFRLFQKANTPCCRFERTLEGCLPGGSTFKPWLQKQARDAVRQVTSQEESPLGGPSGYLTHPDHSSLSHCNILTF